MKLHTHLLAAALAAAVLPAATACASSRPLIVAHRAGTADYPENTLLAIRGALANRAQALWLSVQLSADGVPVLYRPQDLATLTDARGLVSQYTAAQLAGFNAGYLFPNPDPAAPNPYPYRDRPQPLPSLDSALQLIAGRVPVMLDLKTAPDQRLVDAVAAVLERRQAWNNVQFYSTESGFDPMLARHPKARRFETRDATRGRLLQVALEQRCEPPAAPVWTAFELRRRLEVEETFTLGVGATTIPAATLWTPQSVACFRERSAAVGILVIGVNSSDDYRRAAMLGADAVLVDSPAAARRWSLSARRP
ncbi:glycerophosphodiester phosphodiesterase family protein [Lysobacter enzymogenes]|uniref:Lipoprotein n=1 Tax=Lysobacter enzymogenes TaxID=69 RepID=A0AAU9AKB5_LYSEN|nr:glycerophosphodiester phosphodiesterase family protein [Lysobacter enzymogenes]BAV98143.1 lipoprotein [Lysobacter enzymogenes]